MNETLQKLVSKTQEEFHGRLRKPTDLFERKASQDELLDIAVLGGYSVHDILSGSISESELDPRVLHAFHLQYPHAGDFVEFVRGHEGDDAALNGIVQAVKGKLFEVEYVDWLNDGHLPEGATAELAGSPTQEGWDIAIKDSHGDAIEHLQLKASESIGYIKDALTAHPEIDVVTTHEVFQHLDGSGLEDHVTVSEISNNHLAGHIEDQMHAAELTPEFDLPLIAFGIIALQTYKRYKRGQISGSQAIQTAVKRGWRSLLCRGAGYASLLISHEPIIGLPVSVLTRTTFSRFDVQKQFISLLEQYRAVVRRRLELLSDIGCS